MSLRIPATNPHASEPATCEVVLTVLRKRCGIIVDRPGLELACEGDHALIRYSRDVLGLFAELGQVEHVRRDLWIIDEVPPSPDPAMTEEFLRAAVAARALGAWSVIDGRWALVLHGIVSLPKEGAAGLRFGTTTSPFRPGTYCARGASAQRELAGSIDQGNATRHITPIRGVPVAAVRRSPRRAVTTSWLEHAGFGAHVRDAAEAFVTMVEHPRLSGGVSMAANDARTMVDAVGLERLRVAGAGHPMLSVRRRLAFALREPLREAIEQADDPWAAEDDMWNFVRGLDLRHGARPTIADPHRLPFGSVDRSCGVIDNRDAPIAAATSGPGGVPIREQARRELERRSRAALETELAEWEAIERRAQARHRRWMLQR